MNKTNFQVIGYCPGCKESVWYNWHDKLGVSDCYCYLHTTYKQILKVKEEQSDNCEEDI